jgi:hypothetical protein
VNFPENGVLRKFDLEPAENLTFRALRDNFRIAGNPPGASLPLCRLWDQPLNLSASMMCGAKLNEKICECTNAQDEFKRDA